jgi:hypothetical protein
MPAKSKAQQRLFGMALAVRRGELERSKVDDEVLKIVDSDMTDKEIEDFASTKGLKEGLTSLYDFLVERRMGDGWKNWEEDGYKINMLAFDEPSQYGIDKGKISKLWIKDKKSGKVVCNYDRDWDVEPEGDVKDLYDKIIKKYN